VIFVKSLAGGIGAVCIAWFIIVTVALARMNLVKKEQHLTGLSAVAGVWTELLHAPGTVVLLAVAFGVGFYLTVRSIR
jgi:hypothetical protein